MSDSPSLLARLRAGTRDAHNDIETVPAMARLVAGDLTRAEYISILQHLHAFHAYMEPAVADGLEGWPEAVALLDGSRPRALADDLAWFGASAILPPPLPTVDDIGAALGALYVIEGSALGARVIARHLVGSVGISPGAGGSFYCRQDADTARRRWLCLTALLDTPYQVAGNTRNRSAEDEDEDVVAGARETFRFLECWLREIETSPATGRGGGDGAVTYGQVG